MVPPAASRAPLRRRPPVAAVPILGLLMGCPAEQLGIELPPPGAEAITQEDVRRDVDGLLREPAWFDQRMRDMKFEVRRVPGGSCGVRGSGGALAWRAPLPTTTDAASAAAVLIGMAKAWDTLSGPPGERWLCVGGAPDGVPVTEVGWFAAGSVEPGPPIHAGRPDPQRQPTSLDYRQLAAQAQTVFRSAP